MKWPLYFAMDSKVWNTLGNMVSSRNVLTGSEWLLFSTSVSTSIRITNKVGSNSQREEEKGDWGQSDRQSGRLHFICVILVYLSNCGLKLGKKGHKTHILDTSCFMCNRKNTNNIPSNMWHKINIEMYYICHSHRAVKVAVLLREAFITLKKEQFWQWGLQKCHVWRNCKLEQITCLIIQSVSSPSAEPQHIRPFPETHTSSNVNQQN